MAGLNMRLSAPRLLVDITALPELAVSSAKPAEIRLGALTRHRDVLASPDIAARLPLLTMAVRHVGHVAIRNRGTLGGSIAYADPAAELPACCVALDARIHVVGPAGERTIAAEEFFLGLFQTALQPGELVSGVTFPVPDASWRMGFDELARRHGDFAMAGVCAVARREGAAITAARLVYFGPVDRAKLARHTSAALVGVSKSLAAKDLASAAAGDLSPSDTPSMRADTQIHLASVLAARVANRMLEPMGHQP
jgi:carbon-monoxide dehydrogenase medium subunit